MDSYKTGYPLILVIALMLVAFASCDKSKDREECAESLVGLATCLPYVGGTSKSPTPDCCSGLKQMLNTNKKCLCVVIEDRDDPDLGLNINVTLALGLPQTCNAPANISRCPALLNLPPNSSDAQIFYQLGQNSTNNNNNNNNVDDKVHPTPSDSTTPVSSAQEENGGCGKWERFMGLKIFGGILFLWSCYFKYYFVM